MQFAIIPLRATIGCFMTVKITSSNKKNNSNSNPLHFSVVTTCPRSERTPSPRRCAPHRRPGAVSVPYHSLYAQHYHYHFLYLYTPTAKPNLAATAKTVRPREKSFISAISQIQNEAQKRNMNDVRGQEMSEITLLSFWKIPKIGFLRFAEKLKGGATL